MLPGLRSIELSNNNINDEMIALLLIAGFMSPTLSSISLIDNNVKHHSSCVLQELMDLKPEKLSDLCLSCPTLAASCLERSLVGLSSYSGLCVLDLSGTPVSVAACRSIGACLSSSSHLETLRLAQCQLSSLGVRYVVDGLLKNIGL